MKLLNVREDIFKSPDLLINEIVKKKKYPKDFDIINDKKLINHLKRKGFSWNEISTYFNH